MALEHVLVWLFGYFVVYMFFCRHGDLQFRLIGWIAILVNGTVGALVFDDIHATALFVGMISILISAINIYGIATDQEWAIKDALD